jgi:hypothetical protein
MTTDQMLEWTNTVGALACSWPVVALFLLIIFHRPIRKFIDEISQVPGSLSAKVGPVELKREITQIVEQGQEMVTSMHRLQTDVQHDMGELASSCQQTLDAGEKLYRQMQRTVAVMSSLYLFELDAFLHTPEADVSPERKQQVLALRDSLRELQTEFATSNAEKLSHTQLERLGSEPVSGQDSA